MEIVWVGLTLYREIILPTRLNLNEINPFMPFHPFFRSFRFPYPPPPFPPFSSPPTLPAPIYHNPLYRFIILIYSSSSLSPCLFVIKQNTVTVSKVNNNLYGRWFSEVLKAIMKEDVKMKKIWEIFLFYFLRCTVKKKLYGGWILEFVRMFISLIGSSW